MRSRLNAGAIALTVALAGALAAAPAVAQVSALPEQAIAQRLLAAHNAERQRVGVPPLTWSKKLAEHARKWAQTLAVADMIEHSNANADGGEGGAVALARMRGQGRGGRRQARVVRGGEAALAAAHAAQGGQ